MKRYLAPCHLPRISTGLLNSVGRIDGRKRGFRNSSMNRSQAAVTRALSASENATLGLSGLRMAHNRFSPVPRKHLVEPMSRMRGDALEHVGEPRLRIDAVHLGGDDEAVHVCGAAASGVGPADSP